MSTIRLSIIERAMLANQLRILAALDSSNDPFKIRKAIILEKGYEYLYDEVFEPIKEGVPEHISRETEEILDMFRKFENSIPHLKEADKSGMDLVRLNFEGFDAGRDPHYEYMDFIVNEKKEYEEYKGNIKDSHFSGTLGKYRRMLKVFNEVNHYNKALSKEDLQKIIDVAY